MRSPLENAPFCALHHRAGDAIGKLVDFQYRHEATRCISPRRKLCLRTWVLRSELAPLPLPSAFDEAGRQRLPLTEQFVVDPPCAASSAAHTVSIDHCTHMIK